ncbi:hypothetical protein [Rhodanobacter sp. DHG33]|uniref:hypothetical protein n=1 Tax=Rhodanobacter sp. DHG33 TaxID=2775921 RepID=UPI00177B6FB6|nr:hypothetical protein [Rhodanobacter sp. DHG33]MBD8898365.1 hypothetical protein [Rhodanobacter sp. DHG33]
METNLARKAIWACGWAFLGVFVTCFLFYPPHAKWNEGLHLGDVATWFSAIGTIAAVVVALSAGFSQRRKDDLAMAELRSSIANALIVDLLTIRSLLTASHLQWGHDGSHLSDQELHNVLRRVQWLNMPSFEAYRESLPKLGAGVAPYVIEAYGVILRTARIALGQSTTVNSNADDREFASKIIERVPVVLLSIWRAHHALSPYARPLTIAGEPTVEDLQRNCSPCTTPPC